MTIQKIEDGISRACLGFFGIYFLPRDEIAHIVGGEQTEPHDMYLLKHVVVGHPTRDVEVFNAPKPNETVVREKHFKEFVNQKHAGEEVKVFRR